MGGGAKQKNGSMKTVMKLPLGPPTAPVVAIRRRSLSLSLSLAIACMIHADALEELLQSFHMFISP